MEIPLRKQPQKHLVKLHEKTRTSLYAALDEVSELKGDSCKPAGVKNPCRSQTPPFGMIFERHRNEMVLTAIEINTESNIKYKETLR